MAIDDEKIIQREYDILIENYLNSNHRKKVDVIFKAFEFAKKAHQGVRRHSGEPYILHPLAVANIVCLEMGLGSTSIVVALLHDVVEDTEYTLEDISKLFGDKVAYIVDGLTKLSSNNLSPEVSSQTENFRKLLLTMSEDIRVILIKIADRLHNMRTLSSMLEAKQIKIAGETLLVYAPLANRLGLFAIKTELEDLCFQRENPHEYNEIKDKLKKITGSRTILYDKFSKPLIEELNKLGIKYEMKDREKSAYSIWNKMQLKGIPFEEVYDLFAVRIIFESDNDAEAKKRCWDIYSIITDIYKLKPDRIRDWVSRPKSNGYQALHLTVMGPLGQWIEIQIRSKKMDDIAEKGFAAHWKYKENVIEEDAELNKWIKTIKEILENPNPNALDFMDSIKMNLFAQEIFIFTPKGELKTAAQGSSVLDFAYSIHTKVGDHAIGAKVNHKLVPISHILKSGDQVEVLTSKGVYPKEEWLSYAHTAKAKSKIDNAIKKTQKNLITKGEKQLNEVLSSAGLEMKPELLDTILDYYNIASKDLLFIDIATERILLPQKIQNIILAKKEGNSNTLIKYIKNFFIGQKNTQDKEKEETEKIKYPEINFKQKYTLTSETFGNQFKPAQCCKPIAGDKVFGFVNPDNSVDIHKIYCPVGMKLKASYGNRIVAVNWEKDWKRFLTKIKIKGVNRKGIISDITNIINEKDIELEKINFEVTGSGMFVGYLLIHVSDAIEMNALVNKLKKIDNVESIYKNDVEIK